MSEYIEGYQCDKAMEPSTYDFPYDEVFDRLDGEEKQIAAQTFDVKIANMKKFVLWVKNTKANDQRALKSIGIRFVAAMWVINPDMFDDAPAHMVAKSFGLHPSKFKTYTADFSRQFGLRNRFQVHDWQNKTKMKENPNEPTP